MRGRRALTVIEPNCVGATTRGLEGRPNVWGRQTPNQRPPSQSGWLAEIFQHPIQADIASTSMQCRDTGHVGVRELQALD